MADFVLQRREETPLSTWGDLFDPAGELLCKILERGAGNPNHPRIAAGRYQVEIKNGWSKFDHGFRELLGKAYRGILWLPRVPGRSLIEIHTANVIAQLEGCLATGQAINRDSRNNFAISSGTSRPAYKHIYPIMADAIAAGETWLDVRDIAS